MLALALVSALIGFGIIGALTSTIEPAAADTRLQTETRVGGLSLTMTLKNSTYALGEPINITFTVKNISNETISLEHAFPEFDFIVSNSSNSKLFEWTYGKAFPMIVYMESLSPGSNYSSTLVWPQTCNQSWETGEGVQVSPGQYSIVGRFCVFGVRTSPVVVSVGAVNTGTGSTGSGNAGTERPVSMVLAIGVVGVGITIPLAALLVAVYIARKHR